MLCLDAQSCALLSHQLFVTPWTIACQAPPFIGFPRKDYWSGLPFPSPGDLPNPRIETMTPACPASSALPADSLLLSHQGSLKNLSSVQFSRSVVSYSLRPHGLQRARPSCPSPTPGVYLNPCPLRRWCLPTISSSVIPFSSHLQSFPASGSFQMSLFFASGGQSTGVSASVSVLLMNIQDWFPLGWTSWISLQSKGLSRVFSNTTVQKHQFFSAQLSLWPNSHIHTWLLEKPYLWLDGPLLAK